MSSKSTSFLLSAVENLPTDQQNLLLSFFDHFQVVEGNTAAWRWDSMNVFEKRFVVANKDRLSSALSALQLALVQWKHTKDGVLHLACTYKSGDEVCVMNGEQLNALTALLEKQLSKPGLFDYTQIAQTTVNAGVQTLSKMRKYIASSNLSTVQVWPIVPEEPSIGLEMDEISFATGGHFIVFPDANLFNKKHIELVCEMTDNPARIYRDWYYLVPIALLHECLHALQNSTSVQEGNHKDDEVAYFWKLEHSASLGNLNFMSALLKENPSFLGKPAGWAEEATLGFVEFAWNIHKKMSKELLEGYSKWRDSFAKFPPVQMDSLDAARSNSHASATFYMKQRLAIEAFDQAESFEEFIDFHFKPGVVLEHVCTQDIPSALKINPKISAFEALKTRPCTDQKFDEFLKDLPLIE